MKKQKVFPSSSLALSVYGWGERYHEREYLGKERESKRNRVCVRIWARKRAVKTLWMGSLFSSRLSLRLLYVAASQRL